MEAALGYFCRWCARQLNSVKTRYRHEELIHPSEKEISANTCAVPDSAAFVKCNICSIFTTRDKADIASHNQSQHHLRKLRVYAYKPLQPPQAIPLFPPSRGEDAKKTPQCLRFLETLKHHCQKRRPQPPKNHDQTFISSTISRTFIIRKKVTSTVYPSCSLIM